MNFIELDLPGCFKVTFKNHEDERGTFVKTYTESHFLSSGIELSLKEEFYSISKKGVFRGMHFQVPPAAHSKFVYCANGKVDDYLLDLRVNEKTYGTLISLELSGSNHTGVYIPPGIAHGFLSLEDNSVLVYKTDYEYSPEHDAGIHWDGTGIELDEERTLISERDKGFTTINDFKSPF